MFTPQTARFQQRLQRLTNATGNLGLSVDSVIVPVVILDDGTRFQTFEDPVNRLYGVSLTFTMTIAAGFCGVEMLFPAGSDPTRRARLQHVQLQQTLGAAIKQSTLRMIPGSSGSLIGNNAFGIQLERTGSNAALSSLRVNTGEIVGAPVGTAVSRVQLQSSVTANESTPPTRDWTVFELQPGDLVGWYVTNALITEVYTSTVIWREYNSSP